MANDEMTYQEAVHYRGVVEKSPAVSFWLKEALHKALQRDPVDAYHDASMLAAILKAFVDEALGKKRGGNV